MRPDDAGTDTPADAEGDANGSELTTRANPLVAAYRHDVHKLRGRKHADATDTHRGLPVNEQVPLGADRDAALLSRPADRPGQTMSNHTSPYRRSLLTGETARTAQTGETEGLAPLIDPTEPALAHARWLTSSEAALYAEAISHPYTSLKYHTLLTTALLDAYRAGYAFDELWLAVAPAQPAETWMMETSDQPLETPTDDTGRDASTESDATAKRVDVRTVLDSERVVSHRTVLWTPWVTLRLTPTPDGLPAAPLGKSPARSFADTWSRLPEHPVAANAGRQWRVLDAQLRRIRAWSTALQYIEDFLARYGDPRADTAENTVQPTAARGKR